MAAMRLLMPTSANHTCGLAHGHVRPVTGARLAAGSRRSHADVTSHNADVSTVPVLLGVLLRPGAAEGLPQARAACRVQGVLAGAGRHAVVGGEPVGAQDAVAAAGPRAAGGQAPPAVQQVDARDAGGAPSQAQPQWAQCSSGLKPGRPTAGAEACAAAGGCGPHLVVNTENWLNMVQLSYWWQSHEMELLHQWLQLPKPRIS